MPARSDEERVAEVLAAEAARGRAIETCDWDALRAIVADDYEYTHSTAKRETKEEWIATLQERRRAVVREDLAVRLFGDVALVSGSSVYRYAEPFAGDSHFGSVLDVLQVWVERDGAWQIVAHHGVKKPT